MPEASTLGRLRSQLVEHDLWERLLKEINSQLEAKNTILRQGCINIIDATPIELAKSGLGKGKNSKQNVVQMGLAPQNDSRGNLRSTYGYSIHTGVD
jgi:IS5 family transposase